MGKTFLFVGYSQKDANKRLNTIRKVDALLGEEKPTDIQCQVVQQIFEVSLNADGTLVSYVKYGNNITGETATHTLIIICKNRAETIKPYNYILQGEDLLAFCFAVLKCSGLSLENAYECIAATNVINTVIITKKELMEVLVQIDGYKKGIAA